MSCELWNPDKSGWLFTLDAGSGSGMTKRNDLLFFFMSLFSSCQSTVSSYQQPVISDQLKALYQKFDKCQTKIVLNYELKKEGILLFYWVFLTG